MNYHHLPFAIFADDQKSAEAIKQLLGRKTNTTILPVKEDVAAKYLENSPEFACYMFHFQGDIAPLTDLINAIQLQRPFSPIVLFSFEKVTLDVYRKLIQCGISDILVKGSGNGAVTLREQLLKTLNTKWKTFRYYERKQKKVLQATIVTAYHEINQPLTVIVNSVGLINMELKNKAIKCPQIEKSFRFLLKGTRRIQEILNQLKLIKTPHLKEYAKGVPMIEMDEKSQASAQKFRKETLDNAVS